MPVARKPKKRGGARPPKVRQDYAALYDAERDTCIDEDDLYEEYKSLANTFLRYAKRVNRLWVDLRRIRFERDADLAELELAIREDLSSRKIKATDKTTMAYVQKHPKYIMARMKVVDAEQRYNDAKSDLEAIKIKKDMLVNLGSDKRAEVKTHIRM